ncbi:MAG: hypothetical protein LBK08_08890 [Treponema sp.]|nr:hypothetical protein [Treponema sp.]
MKETHPFWGKRAPLGTFMGGGLLVMASSRLAFALAAAGALVWVYVFSAFAASMAEAVFPKKGKSVILLFLSSFIGSLYLLLLWFICPLLGAQMMFIVSLVPLVFTGSGVYERVNSGDALEAAVDACSEALALGLLVAAFSLIREPLGYLSLSLPGGAQGIVRIFSFENGNFLPARIVSSSAGAFVLLGYGTGIYRRLNPREEP